MLFNSRAFLIFFSAIYPLYWALATPRRQNLLLLAASYVFYGAWDIRFLPLLMASTVIDFYMGRKIDECQQPRARKLCLVVSLVVNLGILGVFKYLQFGIESAAALLTALGLEPNLPVLNIILPVGVSFYTFQSISYTIDVYRREHPAVRNLFDYAVFVAYFPQLVAGPIERVGHLFPQLQRRRVFAWEDVRVGLTWVSLGFFKKVVIADTLAPLVDHAFDHPGQISGAASLIAVWAFAIQIYGDFAGYTLIARGVSRMLGIQLMENFRAPYLASSPREFWRRWHISLSQWLQHYLYFSIGGSRAGKLRTHFNLLVTMLLGGLWHGARWNFVLWGLYHGMLLMACHEWAARRRVASATPAWQKPVQIAGMFGLTLGGWLLFRVASMEQLAAILRNIAFNFSVGADALVYLRPTLTSFVLLIGYHLWQESTGNEFVLAEARPWFQVAAQTFLIATCIVVGFRDTPFVYFQF